MAEVPFFRPSSTSPRVDSRQCFCLFPEPFHQCPSQPWEKPPGSPAGELWVNRQTQEPWMGEQTDQDRPRKLQLGKISTHIRPDLTATDPSVSACHSVTVVRPSMV